MCEIEKEFPSPLVNAMVRYLNEKHPLPGRTVVFRPLKQKWLTRNQFSAHSNKAGASITMIDAPVIKARICVGTTSAPASDRVQIQRIAHEYRHALQLFRDGKVYNFPRDEALENDAHAFAKFACEDMMKEATKYLAPLFKARKS